MKDLKKLETLSLRKNHLTDASLEVLKKLPSLWNVDFQLNQISTEKLEQFESVLRDRHAATFAERKESSRNAGR